MVNSVVLVGRITKDIELRKTSTGKSVVSFTVAVNRRFGNQDQADFINCVAWNQTADFMANYLAKGNLISVEGRIQSRSYEDNTGKRVYVTEVVCDQVQALESRGQREQSSGASRQDYSGSYTQVYEPEPSGSFDIDDEPILDITSDDLPF